MSLLGFRTETAMRAAIALRNRLARIEFTTLAFVFICAAGLWGFIEIADEVNDGDTQTIDQTILLAFRNAADPADPIGPRFMEEAARDFTALGGTAFQVFLTIGIVGTLLLAGQRRGALFVTFAIAGGAILNTLLKELFDRPRPDLVPHLMHAMHSSFPSGHSMTSAITYLTLGAMLARLQARKRVKIWLLSLAFLLTFLVGTSRVYLGVHWPSDVVAGWVIGLAYATATWLVLLWFQRTGEVEEAASEGDANIVFAVDDEDQSE